MQAWTKMIHKHLKLSRLNCLHFSDAWDGTATLTRIQILKCICGKAELWFFVGFLCASTLCQNFTGISPERIGNSPDVCQNLELEHLKKGHNHNSAFPQVNLHVWTPSRAYRQGISGAEWRGAVCLNWILCRGGCSGWGVQWIGVVLCNKLVHNVIQITTPCFHCTPLCRM